MDTDPDDVVTDSFDTVAEIAQARVGQTLREKWRLDVLLGVGGMASVYAATHRNGSRGAIKVLHPELTTSAETRARFLREGYASNSVGHPGVVRVTDDDIAEDGSAFLVMDLLDGETLEERRQRCGGSLDEDDVLSVADQVLDVLAAAHEKGVVHRDMKPENVFITRDGQVKVLDFGIARIREASATGTRATLAGHSMGTPSFMAPEQARGLWDQVDGKSDIWALGATMFAVLAGEEVHKGRTPNEVLIEAATEPAPELRSKLPGAGFAVAQVIDKALAFDREDRWRDAAAMQEAVRSAYHHRNGSPISTAPRLTVPSIVSNRTLPSAQSGPISPGQPTTNSPVATSQAHGYADSDSASSDPLQGLLAPRLPRFNPVIAGLVAATAVGIAIGVALSSAGNASSTSSGTVSAGSAPEAAATEQKTQRFPAIPPAPSALRVSPVPVLAVTDLPHDAPSASESNKPAAKRPVTATDQPPVAATPESPPTNPYSDPPAAPSAKPDCFPPYVLDLTTGTKTWKPQCF